MLIIPAFSSQRLFCSTILLGHDLEEAGTNSPDENRETCKLVREVQHQATEAYRARDMRFDAVIIQPP